MNFVGAIGWEVLDRIRFGDFAISPHGIGIAVGYLAGSWWLLREGRKRGLAEDDLSSVLLRALLGAIVGARFFYVLAHFSEFDSFVDMLKIYEGGISLIGGIFGAVIAAYPYMRRRRMGFLRTMDAAAIGLAFGILFGRVGDLIIGDHLGKPTSWLLAFTYEGGRLGGYDCSIPGVCRELLASGEYTVVTSRGAELRSATGELLQSGVGVHQTALYDFISTFFLFALLVWLARRPRHTGVMIATFSLWYGTMRVITDFLRIDKRFFGLTGSQWTSAVVALIALLALYKWSRAGRIPPAEEAEEQPALEPAAAVAAPPTEAPVPTAMEAETASEPEPEQPVSDRGRPVTSFDPPPPPWGSRAR